jgi:hypothetical protein
MNRFDRYRLYSPSRKFLSGRFFPMKAFRKRVAEMSACQSRRSHSVPLDTATSEESCATTILGPVNGPRIDQAPANNR